MDSKQFPKWQEEGFLSTQGVPLLRLSIGEFVDLARLRVFAFLAFISGTLMHRLVGVKNDEFGEVPDSTRRDLAVQCFFYIYKHEIDKYYEYKRREYIYSMISYFLQKFELPPTHIVGSAYGIQIKYKKSKIIAAKTQINGIDIENTNIFSTNFFFKQIII